MKNRYFQTRVFVLSLTVCLVVLSGCKLSRKPAPFPASGSTIPDDTRISIDTFRPLGQCSTLIITADGTASYTPTKYMGYGEPKHKQGVVSTTHFSPAELRQVLDQFEKADFFILKDSYSTPEDGCDDSRVTDLGSTKISIQVNGQTKSVSRWEGCERYGASYPAGVADIDNQIGQIMSTKQLN